MQYGNKKIYCLEIVSWNKPETHKQAHFIHAKHNISVINND